MHAEVLEVGLGYHHAQGVGHAAYAELDGGPVAEVGDDVRCDALVHLAGRAAGQLDGRAVLALDYHVHLGDVYALLLAAQGAGQLFQDLDDDDVRVFDVCAGVARADGEVEVAVLVHGRRAYEGDVYVQEIVIVPAQVAVEHGLVVAQAPVRQLALVAGEVPGAVGEMLLLRVVLHNGDGAVAEHAADLHVRKFRLAAGQGLVADLRIGDAAAEVHPVPALNGARGLLSRAQLAFVLAHIIHLASSHILNRPARAFFCCYYLTASPPAQVSTKRQNSAIIVDLAKRKVGRYREKTP